MEELTIAEKKIGELEESKTELEQTKSELMDELSQLADENSEIKQIMSEAEQQVTEDKETVTSKINDLQDEIDQLANTCQKQVNQIETLQELNVHLKQEKEALGKSHFVHVVVIVSVVKLKQSGKSHNVAHSHNKYNHKQSKL